jgi:hypothetical protein
MTRGSTADRTASGSLPDLERYCQEGLRPRRFSKLLALGGTRAVLPLLVLPCCAFALDPSLDISQHTYTAWKVRDGFAKGFFHCIAQTSDEHLWLGTEFGLLRFDGVRPVPWQPPAGQQLPALV